MDSENFDLFFTLLKLKSYLVSLIDNPEDSGEDLIYTDEYLERKVPEMKEQIIDLLKENEIFTDADIAFNENIHLKFKEMVDAEKKVKILNELLAELEIKSDERNNKIIQIEIWQKERAEKLDKILSVLYHLAKNWVIHKDLENKIDDYSVLDSEELLRPEEEKKLVQLGTSGAVSFDIISQLSKKYIEMLIDYYFSYGGDIPLNSFVSYLENVKEMLDERYKELFRKHGLEPDK